ncbi:MAG: PEGA domain-containing protein, partial [Spirochaetota bacterium]
CSSRAIDLAGGSEHSGSLVDTHSYAEVDFRRFGLVSERAFEQRAWQIHAGDVRGDAREELVVGLGTSASVLQAPDLEKETTVSFGDNAFHLSLLADVDRDGKQDLILGAAGGGNGRIAAYNAGGSTLMDETFADIFHSHTRVHFVDGTRIYFTARSDLAVAPKLVGALDALAGPEPLWIHHMGPVPLGITRGSDGRIAISHRAVSRDRQDVATPYESARDRHALYVLDDDGDVDAYEAFGPEAHEGYPEEDRISGVRTKLFDVTGDGEDEALMLVERVSDLYPGRSLLRILQADGDTHAEYQGPPQTDGSFGFYRHSAGGRDSGTPAQQAGESGSAAEGGDAVAERGGAAAVGEARIVVAWRRTGEVLLLNSAAEPVRQRRLPGDLHYTEIRRIGDFNRDGTVDLIVTDHTRLFILNEELETQFSTVLPRRISDVAVFPDADGRAHLGVLSDKLYVVGPREDAAATLHLSSTPAGAVFFLNDRRIGAEELPVLHGLPPGTHTIRAEIPGLSGASDRVTLEAGRATEHHARLLGDEVRAGDPLPPITIPDNRPEKPLERYDDLTLRGVAGLPEGYNLWGAPADYAGDGNGDLLLLDASRGRTRILDHELELLVGTPLPAGGDRFTTVPDLDGDGVAEIAMEADLTMHQWEPMPTVLVCTPAGRLLLEKPLTRGYDTRAHALGVFGGLLWLRVQTGYLLAPRFLYGVGPDTGDTAFAYPNALQVSAPHAHNGKVYFDAYTFSNGAVVTHEDGTVERDPEAYFHVLTPPGERLPESRPWPGDDLAGRLGYFSFDADGDGARELFATIGKDPRYYTGTPRVYRVHDDGALEVVYTGPENHAPKVRRVPTPEGRPERVTLWWDPSGRAEVLDGSFEPVYPAIERPRSPGDPINLDGDDEWEFPYIREGRLVIEAQDGREIASFSLQTVSEDQDEVRAYRIADLDRDGTAEVVLSGHTTVEVLGY